MRCYGYGIAPLLLNPTWLDICAVLSGWRQFTFHQGCIHFGAGDHIVSNRDRGLQGCCYLVDVIFIVALQAVHIEFGLCQFILIRFDSLLDLFEKPNFFSAEVFCHFTGSTQSTASLAFTFFTPYLTLLFSTLQKV